MQDRRELSCKSVRLGTHLHCGRKYASSRRFFARKKYFRCKQKSASNCHVSANSPARVPVWVRICTSCKASQPVPLLLRVPYFFWFVVEAPDVSFLLQKIGSKKSLPRKMGLRGTRNEVSSGGKHHFVSRGYHPPKKKLSQVPRYMKQNIR